jgi:hypothetical protein
MLETLAKNSEWLFSGAGVVLLSFLGRLLWRRLHPPAPPPVPSAPLQVAVHVASPVLPTSDANAYAKVSIERAYLVRRVRVGDYFDLIRSRDRKIRLTVVSIGQAEQRNSTNLVPAAEICLDFGGGVAACTANVRSSGVNRFLVPQASRDDPEFTAFYFHNTAEYSAFFRVFVEHINSNTQEVDLNIVHLVGLFN